MALEMPCAALEYSDRLLGVAESTEAAQPRLPRVEQLRHRLITQFGQMFDHALLDDLGHALWIAMRSAVRLLQDFVDQAELLEPLRRAAHGVGRDLLFFRALPQDGGTALGRNDRVHAELQHDQPIANADGERPARSSLAPQPPPHPTPP